MDYLESTKVVFQRIQKHDPENVSRIIGYLLLKGYGELEMIRLAFGPEYVIQTLIEQVKREMNSSPKPIISSNISVPQTKCSDLSTKFTPFTPAASSSTWSYAADNGKWIPQLVHNFQYIPIASGGYVLQNHPQFLSFEDQLAGSYFHAPNYVLEVATHAMPVQMSQSVPEFCPNFPELSIPICDNFRQGYCKYGGNCRFLHVLQMESGYFMVLNPPSTDDVVSSNGSLKQLEREMIELLRSRRGIPISISSLPILYYDQYGKVLEIEGYLTEAHRQGKLCCGLSQLLAHMTSSIRLIDRPHGQQSIILTDDIHKYMRFIEGSNDQESSFNFGPVQEVRIPIQEKRMFGFVTFVYPETAALVLTKTNPHYICGSQVLAKPYRQRPMLVDRKTDYKVQQPIHNDPCSPDAESKPSSTPNEKTKLLKKQQTEETEPAVDLDRKHFSDTEVTESLSPPEGVLNIGCTSEDKDGDIKTCNNDQQSFEELNLPDSPFSYEVALEIPSSI
ncbi:hypothetical protein CDL12_09811 [Handroanthus impetiginosus]|uniref:C3H1-type domain-containing protein n=1 Tax=Handroanthus impetiginosus TaxID=429701 RepID=A0A2G9HJC3_9LAMI|nr:hypothetical protein CDL12_09811 [Handroanthus impetiginosus]